VIDMENLDFSVVTMFVVLLLIGVNMAELLLEDVQESEILPR
jgi:hypothetical protein